MGLTLPTATSYIGRFAPSPTGPLHLGSLYTALASYLDARQHKGLWMLRIDDLDTPRNMPGASDAILNCLQSFGLYWDSEVDYQSHHLEQYEQAIVELQMQQALYPCTCSRSLLANSPLIYPGHCRTNPQSTDAPHALRVKTADISTRFVDDLQGEISQNLASKHGDFIVKRKDGIIAYQLACVVDDQRQKVNRVVRGYDLLGSTPKQLYLQHLLGYPTPQYMHIPLIVDQEGHKLSKQTRAQAVNPNQAGPTLFLLLTLLKQNPPPDLRLAAIDSILEWAIEHWQAERLTSTQAVSALQHS
ncbi:tRNA glutamyl-Q(34) synthetase GluQRS [Methylomonas sp. OY6]|uniref:Glutamyl-Q tRNA(Asp) synthetase n=1 Tax=Methylomonas defluvii TaxID=3045149 RepID=A0ABU4UJN9_9GAMM|nr:tRNA glutamyl-Q(34) synthetase GluQRS [Methylomonas sp. OY6]MDX8129727.1 tRNA glutamyl-Q(34) synthetase GluQRS [Methylomonas sp. OY6]